MDNIVAEQSIWIDAPRERAWDAITESASLEVWWGDHWDVSALKVGETIRFYQTEDSVYRATIETVDLPRHFAFRWLPTERYAMQSMLTTFILAAENGGTRVTATDSGFEALPDDIRQTRADETANGYAIVLEHLKTLLESESKETK